MHEKLEKNIDQESKEVLPEELYKQALRTRGTASIKIEKDGEKKDLTGLVYLVDDKEYLQPETEHESKDMEDRTEEDLNDKTKKYKGSPFDLDSMKIVTDKLIVEKIQNEIEKNEAIKQARKDRAKELSQGDELLEGVLLDNMCYRNKDENPDPLVLDGVKFYQVGHNSSHNFYMGTKNGKKYTCNIEPGEKERISVKEVQSWEGRYYGHY